ncbi:MAG: shikimate dehydrogenase [Betaproteobacteria bacterium]|nr:shikimate dehydrogenase [Betaproteobacteria bacterium]MBU6510742.1 shikimate dehydrogenase [Betaproteobacteria bacterium]MDE1956048.1 shikimate dehydrogenase [Betaproteobacteria bacterium]MDE2151744.1 shikimate dehydrogenase [Betaproteobacteria bacterium]MDE2477408.1 shikimate dehydrogenase [Betaproteobacteria bacterium]
MMSAPDLYAVLGNPVQHSRSPRIHELFAAQSGQRLRYERRLVPLGGFEPALAALRAEGGAGCNVTVPFKFDAARAASRLSPRAELAGAANTLGWDEDGRLWGDNTDGVGLVRDLARLLQRPPQAALRGLDLLLLGAGGAASGVLGALLEAGARSVEVWNRSPERAQQLVWRHAEAAAAQGCELRASEAPRRGHALVIHATAGSLGGELPQLPDGVLHAGALAYDMMYGARPTPFVLLAREAGAQGHDGLGMLVEQAAESFWLWRGVRVHTEPVLRQLRAELDAQAAAA